MTRFGKWLKNCNRSRIRKYIPRSFFSCGLSSRLCCIRGFSEYEILVAGLVRKYNFLPFGNFAKQQNSIYRVGVCVCVFPSPDSSKALFTPKPAFEVQHLFSRCCSSEASSVATCPGWSRGDSQVSPTPRSTIWWSVAFARGRMVVHSSKIRSKSRLEISVVGLGLCIAK